MGKPIALLENARTLLEYRSHGLIQFKPWDTQKQWQPQIKHIDENTCSVTWIVNLQCDFFHEDANKVYDFYFWVGPLDNPKIEWKAIKAEAGIAGLRAALSAHVVPLASYEITGFINHQQLFPGENKFGLTVFAAPGSVDLKDRVFRQARKWVGEDNLSDLIFFRKLKQQKKHTRNASLRKTVQCR